MMSSPDNALSPPAPDRANNHTPGARAFLAASAAGCGSILLLVVIANLVHAGVNSQHGVDYSIGIWSHICPVINSVGSAVSTSAVSFLIAAAGLFVIRRGVPLSARSVAGMAMVMVPIWFLLPLIGVPVEHLVGRHLRALTPTIAAETIHLGLQFGLTEVWWLLPAVLGVISLYLFAKGTGKAFDSSPLSDRTWRTIQRPLLYALVSLPVGYVFWRALEIAYWQLVL